MELSPVGYFSKTHGVKGHLILKEEAGFSIEGLKAVFIDGPTGKAPYFISELRDTNAGLMVKLEDVDVIEKARTLIGRQVFVDSKFIEEEEQGEDWTGFELIDKTHGSLGTVTGWSDNGEQDLLSFMYKGREVILPLIEEFIEKIDENKKQIFYDAPEGLINIYLEE